MFLHWTFCLYYTCSLASILLLALMALGCGHDGFSGCIILSALTAQHWGGLGGSPGGDCIIKCPYHLIRKVINDTTSLLIDLLYFIVAILVWISRNQNFSAPWVARKSSRTFQLFISRDDGVLLQWVFIICVGLTPSSLWALSLWWLERPLGNTEC